MGECAITWGVDGVAAEPAPKLVIKLVDSLGNPMQGYKIEGLTDIDETKCITMEDGTVTLRNTWGTYTVTVPNTPWIDAEIPSTTIQLAEGDSKEFVLKPVSKSTKSATIESSQNVIFSDLVKSVDVFCVGGGGGSGAYNNSGRYEECLGGGGGGGYTKTVLGLSVAAETAYTATIGSGGSGGMPNNDSTKYNTATQTMGSSGGTTSFLTCSAKGGMGGNTASDGSFKFNRGGDGGSGGGGGASNPGSDDGNVTGGNGGSDGSDGQTETYGSNTYIEGGKGQGTTTRAFGESSGTLCAGGGAGGGEWYSYNYKISDATPGKPGEGSYGHGGNAAASKSGYAGHKGVVMIRWTNKKIS